MINTNLTNYLQYKEKENQITIYKIIIIYYNVKLAANPARAFFSRPLFIFECWKCWFIFYTVIQGFPEETPPKRQ